MATLEDEAPSRALGCGHAFCSDCWTTYLKSKIQDGGAACLSVVELVLVAFGWLLWSVVACGL